MTNEQDSEDPIKRLLSLTFSNSGLWAAAIVILSSAFFFTLPAYLPLAASVETWSRDVRIAAATPLSPPSPDIVIVALTDETLDQPQFPYRLPVDRAFLAELVRHLEASGARAVGIDILLDRWTETDKDADLMAALHDAQIPVLTIWGGEEIGVVGQRREVLEQFVGDAPTGFGLLLHDRADDTVRIHQPIWAEDQPITLSFPAAIAAALGYDVPSNSHSIAWRGPTGDETPRFAQFPAHQITRIPPQAGFFRDKIVLIGVDLVDIDLHRTPMSIVAGTSRIPGIVIHGHVLSQIIEGRYIVETPGMARLLILVLTAALGMAIAAPNWPLWAKGLGGVLLAGGYLALVVYAYNSALIMLPALMPPLTLLGSAAMTSVFMGRQERAKRAYIRSAFSRYVAPAVVARLDKDPDQLVLGGERREVTFMFTDLAGFTSMSEKLTPSELADLINEYLDGVGDAILKHGGTIDKFIGDGTMSFFGAPEAMPDDPDRAVACAMDLDIFSEEFGAKWRAQGVPVGATRIGIHTGFAVVGNFGGRQRFDYTALGDVVNAASRLEGASKQFGTRILVSQETKALTENAHYRPVGDIVLVGKDTALTSFEAIPAADANSDRVKKYCDAYALLKAGDEGALAAFKAALAAYPDDYLAKYHAERLEAGEQGTRIVLTSK